MAAIAINNAISGRIGASWLALWRIESIVFFYGLVADAQPVARASGKGFRPLMVSRMPQNGFEFGGLLSGLNEKDLKS